MRGTLSRRGLLGGGLLLAAVPWGCTEASASARGGPAGDAVPEAVPLVYPRRQWGARSPKRHARILGHAPDHLVVHHTDTANSADPSIDHAFGLSRWIQDFHMNTRGWDDTGQQLTISRGGYVMEGRNRSLAAIRAGVNVMGAQVLGHNDHTLGIENEGTYMTVAPPALLWSSLVAVCAWLCDLYELDPHTAISGHRDFNSTDCPGDMLYAMLPELRRSVAARLTPQVEASWP